jgi:hypothetical protein
MHLPIDYQYVQMLQHQREEDARRQRRAAAFQARSRKAKRAGWNGKSGSAANPKRYRRGHVAPKYAR